MGVLYVGRRSQLTRAVSTLLRSTGHNLVVSTRGEALRQLGASRYSAVVLCWVSNRSARVARSAKKLGIPVIVIAVRSRLVEAFASCDTFAEVFLEQPANGTEVATLAMELAKLREPGHRVPAKAATAA